MGGFPLFRRKPFGHPRFPVGKYLDNPREDGAGFLGGVDLLDPAVGGGGLPADKAQLLEVGEVPRDDALVLVQLPGQFIL